MIFEVTDELAERSVNIIRMGNSSRVSSLLLQHTRDSRVMAHTTYAKMRVTRETAEQHRHAVRQSFDKHARQLL